MIPKGPQQLLQNGATPYETINETLRSREGIPIFQKKHKMTIVIIEYSENCTACPWNFSAAMGQVIVNSGRNRNGSSYLKYLIEIP
jgi:hypothetical protein